MKSILLTQIPVGSCLFIICTVFLTLIFSATLLWLHKNVKIPGWVVSCIITSFFLTTSIGAMLVLSYGGADTKVTGAELLPMLLAMPIMFLVASTFPLPVSVPLGLAFYFAGRKLHPAKQMRVVGCATTEHTRGTTGFASAFGARKQLPAWKLLAGSSVLALSLVLTIRLPPNLSERAFEPVKPWASLWTDQTRLPMDALMNNARGCSDALKKFAESK
jgi:hypothetical protein